MDKDGVGKKGEEFCKKHYSSKGYDIIASNYHSKFGEIDLIAQNKDTLVFVEVKTRGEGQILDAKDAVTLSKQKKIILTAMKFLESNKEEINIRFDVFEVIHKEGKLTKFRKIENAFEADERVLGKYHF